MFTFRRYPRGSDDDDEDLLGVPCNMGGLMEEERMGFIMFEAGLENVTLK